MQENEGDSSPQATREVTFEVHKRVPFGRALFVAGSTDELGRWRPDRALRLEWAQGDRWRRQVRLPNSQLEFKFLEGEWEGSGRCVEWECGRNRRLAPGQPGAPVGYCGEWSMQHYIFLLRIQDFDDREGFYVTGSVGALGAWHERRPMRRLVSEKGSPFVEICRNNPEFAEESVFSRMFMAEFSVGREVEFFMYGYAGAGESVDEEEVAGRVCRLGGGGAAGRVAEFEWEGSHVVIDDCAPDKMILQRFSNTIYLAARLAPFHFPRLLLLRPSALLLLAAAHEPAPNTTALQLQAAQHRILTATFYLHHDLQQMVPELRQVVTGVERLLGEGHRVCINVSSRAMRLFPIHMLYLILFCGYSFAEALEALSQRHRPDEQDCRLISELYNFVESKLMRGRIEVRQ